MKTPATLRALAAQLVYQVVERGQSLSTLLPVSQSVLAEKAQPLLKELTFGVLRTLPLLEWFASQLIARPLTGKQRQLHYLILLGFYQLAYSRIAPHAVVSETVNATLVLKCPALKKLVNGVLREFQRRQQTLQAAAQQQPCRYLHPDWLLLRLQQAWPDRWQQIIDANNQRPPMWLRINPRHISRDDWMQCWLQQGLQQSLNSVEPADDPQQHHIAPAKNTPWPHPQRLQAVRLEIPVPVHTLPGFTEGWLSVQDAGAQRCVELLAPQNGEHIVDLCAAPGGKTTHILELAPAAQVVAVDISDSRLKRVRDNLQRMAMQAEIIVADGCHQQQWSGNHFFDRILLDAPCSATGVIRRHPDIKWLRRDSDIGQLVALQAILLRTAWSRLKPGGTLLYATCSLLPEENQQQIQTFLAATADACLSSPMEQLFPGEDHSDGFFYARLLKQES